MSSKQEKKLQPQKIIWSPKNFWFLDINSVLLIIKIVEGYETLFSWSWENISTQNSCDFDEYKIRHFG